MNIYIVTCPTCDQIIEISKNEVNCKIFRHGVYKSNFLQIDPHSSKEKCDELIRYKLIYGCGKPFKLIVMNDGSVTTEICDYI